MIFIISAPSGAGKTTIVRELANRVPNLARLATATTRLPREGETDGSDYTFVSEDTFRRMIEAGEFAEWRRIYASYYGVPRASIEGALGSDLDFAVILDVYGAQELKRDYPSCVSIFIMPAEVDDLRRRLALRRECSSEEMRERLGRIDEELAFAPLYDHVVVNRSIDQAVSDLGDIIAGYRARGPNRQVST